MINVLFIAIEFAPVNTTGNYRSLKFVKYFQDFGINPIVITLDVDSSLKCFKKNATVDDELLQEIPPGTEIIRIPCEAPDKYYSNRLRTFFTIYLSIKDNIAKRWKNNLFCEIGSIIAKYNPKAIITTLPPFSSGLLAVQISKKFDLPLLIDMRDGWAKWCVSPYGSRIHYYLTYLEEKKIFKHASAVTTVTRQLAEVFRETHPEIEAQKFFVITNGYDYKLELPEKIEIESLENKKEFTIGYVGSFYYSPNARKQMFTSWWKKRFHRMFQYTPVKEDWLYRSPYFFFKSLNILLKRNPDLRSKVRVNFIGDKPDWMDEMVNKFKLDSICYFYGKVKHKKGLEIIDGFDAFLCTSVKVHGGKDYALASKTFDYVNKHKPIIGFVTQGAQQEFLEKSGLGFICDPNQPYESSLILEKVIIDNYTLIPNKNYLEKFSRRNITEKMAGIIKNMVNI